MKGRQSKSFHFICFSPREDDYCQILNGPSSILLHLTVPGWILEIKLAVKCRNRGVYRFLPSHSCKQAAIH